MKDEAFTRIFFHILRCKGTDLQTPRAGFFIGPQHYLLMVTKKVTKVENYRKPVNDIIGEFITMVYEFF